MDTRCGNCRFFEPCRDPYTNRVRPSQAGCCSYKLSMPLIPDSVEVKMYCRAVWPGNGRSCPCFEAKAKARKPKVAPTKLFEVEL